MYRNSDATSFAFTMENRSFRNLSSDGREETTAKSPLGVTTMGVVLFALLFPVVSDFNNTQSCLFAIELRLLSASEIHEATCKSASISASKRGLTFSLLYKFAHSRPIFSIRSKQDIINHLLVLLIGY